MKILITGAAGCLGTRVVNTLVSNKLFNVFATDIKENPFEDADNLYYQCLDLRNKNFDLWLEEIKPDKIVHLASILQLTGHITREVAYEIDVIATKKLLDKSIALHVDKFITTSSGAAYGYFPENKHIITEDRTPKGNKDYFYSAHKAEVEQYMADLRQSNPQLKQVIFRPGAVLGPNFHGPVVNLFQQKMIVGLIGYPGPFTFSWSEDIVDYIIEALTSDINGEFNIAGDGILTMKDIAKIVKKPYLPLPSWLIQAALTIAKPLGLSQYGPEQVKFIKYRPVLANDKIKQTFTHQPRYTSKQALVEFLNLKQP